MRAAKGTESGLDYPPSLVPQLQPDSSSLLAVARATLEDPAVA